jgi:hypothetical protein
VAQADKDKPMSVELNRVLAMAVLATLVFTGSSSWAQSPQDRAAAADRRWAEYQEMLQSSNPITRSEGLTAALADENLGIRGNAIWSVLQRRQTLPIAVVVPPGGRIGPGEVPNVAVFGMHWNPEQRSFDGVVRSFGYAGRVTGAAVSGKLQITYSSLRVPARFGLPSDVPLTGKNVAVRTCTVSLSLSPARDALEGQLRCEEMPETLALQMPLE